VILALRIAGVKPSTLAVGGAFTAVLLGLAAQQALGGIFAGGATPRGTGRGTALLGP
jgi:small conductance mechanosensitive channel